MEYTSEFPQSHSSPRSMIPFPHPVMFFCEGRKIFHYNFNNASDTHQLSKLKGKSLFKMCQRYLRRLKSEKTFQNLEAKNLAILWLKSHNFTEP